MINASRYVDGVWAVDFEFHPAHGHEGNAPTPVCMVARDLNSGTTVRLWQDELAALREAPFPVGADALFVAYYASAEMSCFLTLGWPLPANTLDLFTEFRCATNGLSLAQGNGLLGALSYYCLPAAAVEEKDSMRQLVLRGGPWTPAEKNDILDYCESDVAALESLLLAMSCAIDWPRAPLRGRYMQSVAQIESVGVPIDVVLHQKLQDCWLDVQDQLIANIDRGFGVFEGRTFKASRFERYLAANDIPWPRHPSGALDLQDDTFKAMTRTFTQLTPLRELRTSLASMRLSKLTVGTDGRNRCMLSAFRSTTGRNQPSTTQFIFGPSAWMRGLIRPAPGWGLVH